MERTLATETPQHTGSEVKLQGWIDARRDHGKLVFFDVRDRSGTVQVVITPKSEAYQAAQEIRPEWVVEITGIVQERPQDMKNAHSLTGEIEVAATSVVVLTQAKTLPLPIDTAGYEIGEETRLTYRYLDLRRERLQRNIRVRHQIAQYMRIFLAKEGFTEIETPILTKSTPEGARDFLVPSRTMPGTFYALPQSPQQYKQLLQVAGFERYFQIVRCFRDEDPRGDRQAEFTQLDIEMSFVEQEEILELVERLYKEIVHTLFPEKRIKEDPFPRITYKEAIEKWGSDKPDLRNNPEDPNELAFAFIVDFPAFEWKEQDPSTGSTDSRQASSGQGKGRWDAVHHPFTRPKASNIEEIKKDPASVTAHQYDFVLNGWEIGGGSLRVYDPKFLADIFEFMGNSKEEVQEKFGHLLEAFQYGVPPHGGIAPGLDRFVSLILNEPNIREVMAFPKTGDNRDLMMQAPSPVSEEQLRELHLKIEKPERQ